jgi:uncharacterized protein YjiS (DUF1127 family)
MAACSSHQIEEIPMLYRQPRPFAVRIISAVLARIAGFAAELHRVRSDTAYLDHLNEDALRDLGIRRIEARDDRFYR